MNRSYFVPPALAAGILGLASPSALAQTTIFSDTFGSGSTVQTAPSTPTANSTTYEYFLQGTTPTTPTIASGDLHLQGRATTSQVSEIQARFTSSPVTLATVGDSLNFSIVFTDTQDIFPAGTNSTLNIGLFNSGGSAPVVGTRLDSTGSGTGGAVGWNGYVARIGGTGANAAASVIFTRPPQGAGKTNPNQSQDVLFNGASGSGSFNNPTGSLIATTGGQLSNLTQGNTYTLSYTITLSASGTLTIDNDLYSGAAVDSNNLLISQTGTTSSSPVTSFDGLGFGWRYTGPTAANSVDVSSITVSDNIAPVPEPSLLAMTGLAAAGLALRFRRSRN